MKTAVFFARRDVDRWHAQGVPRWSGGHRLPSATCETADGIFAEWMWDGRRLSVANDRYGFHPLFYTQGPDFVGVSPSIVDLLRHGASTEWDYDALAVFLRLGFFIGEDTPFRAIRALPPNARAEWEDGVFGMSGGEARVPPQRLGRTQALDAFIALVERAVDRRIPPSDDVAVPLSGGRDSRHILLQLCAAGRKPRFCLTLHHHPPRSNTDADVARDLTDRLGIPHVVVEQTHSRLSAEVRKNWATSLCADEHGWFMAMADRLNGNVSAIFDGIAGVLSATSKFLSAEVLDLFDAGRFDLLAERLIAASSDEQALRAVCAPEAYRRMGRELAVSRVADELSRHAGAADPVKSFHFWNRTRREIALVPYGLLNGVPLVYSPFLDHELFDVMFALPPDVISPGLLPEDKTFHAEAIARAYPRFADLPFADVHHRIDARTHYAQLTRDLAVLALRQCRHHPTFLNRNYVLPRLLTSMVSRRCAERVGWMTQNTMYLLQLEMAGRLGGANDGDRSQNEAHVSPNWRSECA